MQDSSCLVLTALYEGFGLSIIEALSAGRPAFAFDVGAIREVLEPIDDSIISPPRDIDSIVSKIESYLSLSESDRMEKGNEYRKKVLDLYSIDKSGKSLEALYKKIV